MNSKPNVDFVGKIFFCSYHFAEGFPCRRKLMFGDLHPVKRDFLAKREVFVQ